MVEVESGVAEAAVERVVLVAEFPGGDGGGNFVERVRGRSRGPYPLARGMRLR